MKLLKILGWALFGVVLLLVAGAIAAVIWFDPNDFRGRISTAVKEQTGRELTIAGDIKLRLFPWLGVNLSQVTMGNAPGFGAEPFAQIGEAEVTVRVLPLLMDQQVRAGTVSLKGLRLNLAVAADGKNNWDDLAAKDEAKPDEPESASKPVDLDIGGLKIEDAAVSFVDAQAKKSYKVENFELKTGKLTPKRPADVTMGLVANLSDPKLRAEIKMGTTVLADLEAKHYQLSKFKLDVTASGEPIPGGKQELALRGELDLDMTKGLMKLTEASLEAAGLRIATTIDGKNLSGDAPSFTGPISIASFSPRKLLDKLQIKIPEPADSSALTEASLTANLLAGSKSLTLSDLKLKLDQTNLTGQFKVRDFTTSALEFAFNIDAIDADRYLSAPSKEEANAKPGTKSDINKTEIPVDALDKLNANGTLSIGSLTLSGLKMTEVSFKVAAAKGQVKTQQLSGKLYGGDMASSVQMTPGARPGYAIKAKLTGVNAGPLLKDLADKDVLTGVGNFTLDVTSGGRTIGDARRALNGGVGFEFADGAVKGIDIGGLLRQGRALLRGEQAEASKGPVKTDFAELKGQGKFLNGVLTTDFLTAKSPAFRLEGEGSVDLVAEQINYLAKPTVVDSSKGQGGAEVANLKAIVIPIRITGSMYDPKYTIDVQEALKQQATDKLRGQYKKEEDKLKGKIGDELGRFLRRSAPPAEPAPVPAPAP
jgi:AsmA protein